VTLERFSLAGKKALVTGASRGIGRVIAVAFAEAGADVAVTARGADGLAVTAKGIRDFSREAVEIPADLTTRQAADGAVATAIDPGRRPGDGRDRAHGPLGQAGRDGRPGRLPGERRLVVHDRPGACHRRRPDQHRLGHKTRVPRPERAGAHTRFADRRYSVHQSSSFSLPAPFWAGAAAVGAGAPLPPCGRAA